MNSIRPISKPVGKTDMHPAESGILKRFPGIKGEEGGLYSEVRSTFLTAVPS